MINNNSFPNVQTSSDDQINLWRSDAEAPAPMMTSGWNGSQADAEEDQWKSDAAFGSSGMVSGDWDQNQDEEMSQTVEQELRVTKTILFRKR